MVKIPTISIASHCVTRLIIGGNPYSGISHRSPAASKAMEDYYTTRQIMADLAQAEQSGINTVLARADRHIMRTLNEYWNAGGTIQWIAQTPKATEYADLNEYLQIIARYKPIAIYHHGGTTDTLYAEGRLDSLRDSLVCIRDLGCAVGIGTHDPRVLKHCYAEEYDVDFYVCALYNHTQHRGHRTRITSACSYVTLATVTTQLKKLIILTSTLQNRHTFMVGATAYVRDKLN